MSNWTPKNNLLSNKLLNRIINVFPYIKRILSHLFIYIGDMYFFASNHRESSIGYWMNYRSAASQLASWLPLLLNEYQIHVFGCNYWIGSSKAMAILKKSPSRLRLSGFTCIFWMYFATHCKGNLWVKWLVSSAVSRRVSWDPGSEGEGEGKQEWARGGDSHQGQEEEEISGYRWARGDPRSTLLGIWEYWLLNQL